MEFPSGEGYSWEGFLKTSVVAWPFVEVLGKEGTISPTVLVPSSALVDKDNGDVPHAVPLDWISCESPLEAV